MKPNFQQSCWYLTPVVYGTPTFKHLASAVRRSTAGWDPGTNRSTESSVSKTPAFPPEKPMSPANLASRGTISTVLGAQPGPTPASRSSSSIRNCWSSRLHRFSDSSSCTRASSRLLWRVVRPRSFQRELCLGRIYPFTTSRTYAAYIKIPMIFVVGIWILQ